MNPLTIIAWIIFGVIAGAIAKLIVPGRQGGGFFATAMLGIVGAFIGGIAHNFISNGKLNLVASRSFDPISLVVAVLGAIVAVFLWGMLTGRTDN